MRHRTCWTRFDKACLQRQDLQRCRRCSEALHALLAPRNNPLHRAWQPDTPRLGEILQNINRVHRARPPPALRTVSLSLSGELLDELVEDRESEWEVGKERDFQDADEVWSGLEGRDAVGGVPATSGSVPRHGV